MKTFYREVEMDNREAMIAFLSSHFRYDTMRSWNGSTSYANCVKIDRLELSREQMVKAWNMLYMPQVFQTIDGIIQDWAVAHGWKWNVGFNGKSNGYLVLYQGGLDWENARTAECDACGALTWHKADIPCTAECCSGILRVLEKPKPQIVTYPGRGLDESEDFAEWDMDQLRDRVRLVQDFDKVSDECVAAFVHYCENYIIVEKDILVPKTIKVLECA